MKCSIASLLLCADPGSKCRSGKQVQIHAFCVDSGIKIRNLHKLIILADCNKLEPKGLCMLQRKTGGYAQKIKELVYMHVIFKTAYTKQASEDRMWDSDQRICVLLDENSLRIHSIHGATTMIPQIR